MTKPPLLVALAFILSPASLVVPGCSPADQEPPARLPFTLQELAVHVDGGSRQFFFSDKCGGFLSGSVTPGTDRDLQEWSVDGAAILSLSKQGGKGGFSDAAVDSAWISPDRVMMFYRDGVMVMMEPLEHSSEDLRALAVQVTVPAGAESFIEIAPAKGFVQTSAPGGGIRRWQRGGSSGVLYLVAGEGVVPGETGVSVRGGGGARIVLVFSDREIAPDTLLHLLPRVPSLLQARAERMERLLNRSYLRLSDRVMTKAVSWIKLSLDGLLQEGRDTLAVSGLPWNGEFSGRDNAQSLSGLGLATGDYGVTSAILRSLGRFQDTARSHVTYGRIPDRISGRNRSYSAVDAAPWFVRELYEHVNRANDTALARAMYPVIERSIRGASEYNASGGNLLVHRPGEVRMGEERFAEGRSPGTVQGGRYAAVELQLLWYFQQLIGSYVAYFVGERQSAVEWEQGARATTAQFDRSFIDTTRKLLYDHLDREGRGVLVRRPNAFFALEVLGDEAVQQNMMRELMGSLLYPHGVGTLASSEPEFSPYLKSSTSDSSPSLNGPIWTYLLGQATYALTRYDRGDLSFHPAEFLLHRVLEEDVVGSIPQMFDVRPRPGERKIRSGGSRVYLLGMAEFVRSMYQDYFGIHVDAVSMLLRTEPKLPEEITDVEYTVLVGGVPIEGSYHRGVDSDRITLNVPELPRPLKWSFLWILKGGDAWRGAMMLNSGDRISVVMTASEVAAFRGEKGATLEDQWKISGFSRRNDVRGLDFADPGR
jgi:glycogen debranching enzyme